MKHQLIAAGSILLIVLTLGSRAGADVWRCRKGEFTLTWDLDADAARLVRESSGNEIWHGPLLPGFWLQLPSGERRFVKAEIERPNDEPEEAGGQLRLRLPGLGRGVLNLRVEAWGIRFQELRVTWDKAPPAIIGLYFGTAPLTEEQRTVVPSLELPYWPAWAAEGYAVPSGKGGPVQSFFRNWDLGHATFPLGSFGPSLGTPYAAAYPRPVFSAAMGGEDGWVAFGPGSVPDAALTYEVRATTGTLHYLYREDLWGAAADRTRIWPEPLRLAFAPTAWDAFRALFSSFDPVERSEPAHQQAHWNTWGNFKERHYDLRFEADNAARMGAQVLQIDDGWESGTGSGTPNLARFPHFGEDLKYIRDKGLALGFWVVAGWIADPFAAGLSTEDLLVGKDGRTRRVSWNMAANSSSTSNYCLDPSSPRARDFLRQRTIRMMKEYAPQVLKLDFGYGIPSPDVAVPRDPAFRGERLALELLRIISDAAREVNPHVTIQYYSIHPLMRPVTDIVALDDLGDGGNYEAEAHSQWAIWSSLAASRGAAVMASSGYDWKADTDVLLDTAVIGAPGAVLPLPKPGQEPLPQKLIAHRQALARWYRRTVGWEPLWLDSVRGSIGHEPALRSFGRIEHISGTDRLTALSLRSPGPVPLAENALRDLRWAGRWAVISQDDESIFGSRKLACIPFDAGFLEIPMNSRPRTVLAVRSDGEDLLRNWTFDNGRLRLEVPLETGPLLGFLVIRD